jgi:predicted metal-dependent hydrolase
VTDLAYEIDGMQVDIIRKPIKNLHLAIYPPNGRIRLAVPLRTSDATIRGLLATRTPWIRKHLRSVKEHEWEPPREYLSGETHYVGGNPLLMKLIYRDAPPSVNKIANESVELYVRPGSSLEKRRQVYAEWLRLELKRRIEQVLLYWKERTGLETKTWEVKQMKTKWGSCNIRRRHITINLELARKSEASLRYVVLHELLHFRVRMHNKEYTAHLTNIMPNWRLIKSELNNFTTSL